MKDCIAIDFGTMRTKLSYVDPQRNTVELMRLGVDERLYVPSEFYLGEDGRRLFGDDAVEYLDSDPLAFLPRPLKRELREQWVRAGNRVKATPTELLSILFAGLRDRAKEIPHFRDALPTGLSLTIPAQYGLPDKDILTRAAHNAGFNEERITFVDEPIAAAQAWFYEVGGQEECVTVLDCGGGTLDWACLQRTGCNTFEMIPELPPGGDNRVGGFDIDEALYAIVDDAITDAKARTELQINRCSIRDQIRIIKEKYSRTGKGGKIHVGNIPVEIPPDVLNDVIARRFISQACQNLGSYIEKVRDKTKLAKPTVLLVGGSARLRGFQQAVTEQCKCNAVWWERSEYATVLGALRPEAKETCTSSGVPAVSRRKPMDAKAKDFITAQKKSHEDFRHFLRETFLVQWRLSNSVYGSANACSEALQTIQEGEDKKSISLKVRQALEGVSIASFDEIVNASSSGFVDLVSDFIQDLPSRYITLFSGLEPFRLKFTPPAEWKRDFVCEVAKDLGSLKGDYEAIASYYNQLAEFYPRYDGIMSRAGWLDVLIYGAVGFFTGGLGVVAAAIWGGWKGMNDDDFMKNYSAAIQNFIDACVKFNEAGERVLISHIQRVNDVWDDAFKPMAEMYLALAQMGEDLESVEKKANALDHAAEFATDAYAHRFAAIIVANLKQQPDVSKKTLNNIVNELRSSGILLTKSGDLDEKAVASLPQDENTKMLIDLMSEMMAIIGRSPCCTSDRFYIAPKIPQDKLVNSIKAYGYGCGANDVLALYDDTFWGGGDVGFMVTLGGVFWTGPNSKAWNDIKRITKAGEGNALKIDGLSVSIAMASESLPHFVELFKELRECVVRHLPTMETK